MGRKEDEDTENSQKKEALEPGSAADSFTMARRGVLVGSRQALNGYQCQDQGHVRIVKQLCQAVTG